MAWQKAPPILNLSALGTSGPFHGPVTFTTRKIASQIGSTAVPGSMKRYVVKCVSELHLTPAIQPTKGRRRSAELSRPPFCRIRTALRLYPTHTCTQLSAVLLHVHNSLSRNKLTAASVRRQQNILKSKSEGGGERSETRKRLKRKRPTKRTGSIEPHGLTKEGRCKKRRMEFL